MYNKDIRMSWRGWILVLVLVFLAASPVFAHKIGIFAAVKAGVIEGEVYALGGEVLKNCPVVLLDSHGETVAETRTEVDGTFRFEASASTEYLIVVNTGDGHRAEYKIGVAESGGSPTVADETKVEGGSVPNDLDQRIATAVSREVFPLCKQIAEYERKIRVSDIIGGLGYILGLAGIVFYLKAGKRRGVRGESAD